MTLFSLFLLGFFVWVSYIFAYVNININVITCTRRQTRFQIFRGFFRSCLFRHSNNNNRERSVFLSCSLSSRNFTVELKFKCAREKKKRERERERGWLNTCTGERGEQDGCGSWTTHFWGKDVWQNDRN